MPTRRSPNGSASTTGDWLASSLGTDASHVWLAYAAGGVITTPQPVTVVVASTSAAAAMVARERLHERGFEWTVAVRVEPLSGCPEDDVSAALLEDERHRARGV